MNKSIKNWMGHEGYGIGCEGERITEAGIEERMRPRGRPRIGMIDDLIENSYI